MSGAGLGKTKDECIEELDAQIAELVDELAGRDETIAHLDRMVSGLKHELAAAATKLVTLDDYRERHITELHTEASRAAPGGRVR